MKSGYFTTRLAALPMAMALTVAAPQAMASVDSGTTPAEVAARSAGEPVVSIGAPLEGAQSPLQSRSRLSEWRVHGTRGISFPGDDDRWYFAELATPCVALGSATRIVYTQRPTAARDRPGTFMVRTDSRRTHTCAISSLVEIVHPDRETMISSDEG